MILALVQKQPTISASFYRCGYEVALIWTTEQHVSFFVWPYASVRSQTATTWKIPVAQVVQHETWLNKVMGSIPYAVHILCITKCIHLVFFITSIYSFCLPNSVNKIEMTTKNE